MQVSALDENEWIFAEQAVKNKDYTCPACKARVRLRGGRFQQLHFFHVHSQTHCHQHAKSAIHLQTQKYICSKFPDAFMEYYFPDINRFADVVIPSKKLIFEVQCSPISLFEVRARQAAYSSTGYQLIWILHDSKFNRRGLSDVEKHLRKSPTYFTNIDARGQGFIYDQLIIRSNVKRLYIGKNCPISLIKPFKMCSLKKPTAPQFILQRENNWPLYFQNDLFDRCCQNESMSKYLKRTEARYRRLKWMYNSRFFQKLFGSLNDLKQFIRNQALAFAED